MLCYNKIVNILETEKLTKIYGKGSNSIKAVDNVSFKVKEGDFISIVGTSGSGKSTLLHLLGGVDRPTSGRVLIDGKDIYKLSNNEFAIFRRREIGIVYQSFNLIPILNVEDNITLPLKLDHQKINNKKLEHILGLLSIKRQRKYLPNQLSGGQQQRVAIARALIGDPCVILADEPTGNLDSKNSQEIIGLLRALNDDSGCTIIIVTHDENIARHTKRIIRFEDGRIVEDERKNT